MKITQTRAASISLAAVFVALMAANILLFWESPGTMFLAVAALLIAMFAALLGRGELTHTAWYLWFVLPGVKLLDRDLLAAQESKRNGPTVTKYAYLVLFLCVLGLGGVSGSNISLQLGWVPPDWSAWPSDNDFTQIKPMLTNMLKVSFIGGSVYAIFTLVLNLLTALIIRAGFETDVARNTVALLRYFGLSQAYERPRQHDDPFWTQLSKQLDGLYGHKAWSGPKTFKMLSTIQGMKGELGSAQWILLESAADAMDQNIDAGTMALSYNYSSGHQYSAILARTIGYSSKHILWIADSDDLMRILFPVAVREATFSLADWIVREHRKDDRDAIARLEGLRAFAAEGGTRPGWQLSEAAFCEMCKGVHGKASCSYTEADCDLLPENNHAEEMLRVFERWAAEYVSHHLDRDWRSAVRNQDLFDSALSRGTDRFQYPHLQKYHACAVPKSRIFCLHDHEVGQHNGYHQPFLGKDTYEHVLSRLLKIASPQDWNKGMLPTDMLIQLASKCVDVEDDWLKAFIFCKAWALFANTCNSNVAGFAEVEYWLKAHPDRMLKSGQKEGRAWFDIGIYDDCVAVMSAPIRDDHDDDRKVQDYDRKVQWGILGPDDPVREVAALFRPDPERDKEDEQECVVNGYVYTLRRFAEDIMAVARSIQ